MIELGENLALVAEATKDQVRIHSALDKLQCYLMAEFSIVTSGKVIPTLLHLTPLGPLTEGNPAGLPCRVRT